VFGEVKCEGVACVAFVVCVYVCVVSRGMEGGNCRRAGRPASYIRCIR
jgi:hypothetical protein